jgi:superfamily II RNA helicase
VGLLTGDIKMNPAADVLIMTTEILQKQLYNRTSEFFSLELDFTDVACVIFDEVHYINDADRGHVWEETIINVPTHIQMVMLSATIDNPSKFALWCEKKYTAQEREVWLIPTYTRVVPLTHYGFVTTNASCFKCIKDKDKQKEIKAFINTLLPVKDASGVFLEKTYADIQRFLQTQKVHNIQVTTRHVLNEVCNFMAEREMLPALCFVLSRKNLEVCAKGVTSVLLEDDSKIPYIIAHECEMIIRHLPNYREYLQLPEYHEMVKLLEKGIAIHHAGVMPVLREMVEILYAKGFVKLLFATETFAVGVNMPTKTVVFTDVTKHDGKSRRTLHPHEYTQMSGRAGRRGIDKVGNVILLYNLFSTEIVSHREMLYGHPPSLKSKFRISLPLLLNLISTQTDIPSFVEKSMFSHENNSDKEGLQLELSLLSKKAIPVARGMVEEYDHLSLQIKSTANKKRKEWQKKLDALIRDNPLLSNEKEMEQLRANEKILTRIDTLKTELTAHDSFVETMIQCELQRLVEQGFVECSGNVPQLTRLGVVASQLNEVNPLFSKIIVGGGLDAMTTRQLVGIFSCFTDMKCEEGSSVPVTGDAEVERILYEIMDAGSENAMELVFDFIDITMEWCDCEDEPSCKQLLQRNRVFLGDFVKGVLKIVNIAREVEKTALFLQSPLMEAVSNIPNKMLKYMVNSQSLYI